MICRKVKANLPDLLLAPESAAAEVRAHAESCAECARELRELRATMAALDAWEAPEVSPYFDGKMAARLREEREAAPAGWLERMRVWVRFGNHMSLRPVAATALGVALLVGGGMYVEFTGQPQHPVPTAAASPVIQDLQSLDENQQVFQQLNLMDQQQANNSGSGSAGSTL
jgi:anti-sigma factor RsiW